IRQSLRPIPKLPSAVNINPLIRRTVDLQPLFPVVLVVRKNIDLANLIEVKRLRINFIPFPHLLVSDNNLYISLVIRTYRIYFIIDVILLKVIRPSVSEV